MSKDLEEGDILQLDFSKLSKIAQCTAEVVPVVVQDAESGQVLILAYANEEAIRRSLQERKAVFWSTSRNELWRKGETSGNLLELIELRVNCEQNSLLYKVKVKGEGACHTRDKDGRYRKSCYYRRLTDEGSLELD